MESGCEVFAGLGSNSLGWKRFERGRAVRAGGAEKRARGGKLTAAGRLGGLALGCVQFWGDVRNGPELGLSGEGCSTWNAGALENREDGWLFVVPRGTYRRSKQRLGESAGERTDFQLKASNFQRFLQRFIFSDF